MDQKAPPLPTPQAEQVAVDAFVNGQSTENHKTVEPVGVYDPAPVVENKPLSPLKDIQLGSASKSEIEVPAPEPSVTLSNGISTESTLQPPVLGQVDEPANDRPSSDLKLPETSPPKPLSPEPAVTSVPPVVEPQTSDLRQENDPVSMEKAAEMEVEKQERDLTNDAELAAGMANQGDNQTIASTASTTNDIVAPATREERADPEKISNSLPTAEGAPVSPQPPVVQAEELKAEKPSEPVAIAPPASANIAVTEDKEMVDAPLSPSRPVREREADDDTEEPAAKRTKTQDDDASSAPGFKVPELPPPALSTLSVDTAVASPPSLERPTDITKARHKFLLSAVRNLKRNKDASAFAAPVDPVALNIPTYPTIVQNPMDLSTMEEKLKNDGYAAVEEFVEDFNLIVHNTSTFNGPDHFITQQAKNLKATFDRQLSNLPKPDVVEPTAAEKKAKKKEAAANVPKTTAARRESRSSTGVARSPTATAAAGSPTTFALGPSGTPLIRRESTTNDGRPKREIHPPAPRDLPYSASKPKKKKFQWELKFCQEVLTELNKAKHASIANPFYYPVDPVAMNIPNYHKVVKKPMDMSTMGSKLKSGQYENAKEFESDFRLMLKNCFNFNPEPHPVHSSGKALEALFNEKWAQKARWIDDHIPASEPQSPVSSPEPEEEEREDEEEEEEEEDEQAQQIKIMQQHIEMMSKQVEMMQKKKKGTPPQPTKKGLKTAAKAPKKPAKKGSMSTAPAAPKVKPEKKKKAAGKSERTPYITYEQKQEISNRINTLPTSRMSTALKIIRDNMPNLKGLQDDELELDIDELSDEVLHKLYLFVQKYAPGGKGDADVKPARSKPAPEARANTGKTKKNKPMGRNEQESKIEQIRGQIKNFTGAGSDQSPEPLNNDDDEAETSEDDDESGSESEEE
ncbi:MAG: hypothetical protein M1833_006673 [Piccolia ochrophora]|nr:MAG: hypothetical protein M1833_006673 [Piccolia ochrophora]